MSKVIYVKSYGFRKPEIISESDYKSYKQVLSVDSSFSFIKKPSFWEEFEIIKWSLLGCLIGFPLAIANEVFSFIPGLSFAFLVIGLLGSFSSIMDFNQTVRKMEKYDNGMKSKIKSTSDYSDFKNEYENWKITA
jgi:hypothetical protein